jgi:DNA (cytosine-5)-methyltransferase 1
MRAIDLYSGVGGWTLGLEMAGIETVASYEWWDEAARTYAKNFNREPVLEDIRKLRLEDLPGDIDFVVGSPPCTEFSFSNRGGNGDIVDGMKDIRKFLEVVDFVSPEFWVMENVPRVAGLLERALRPGGSLRRFAHLVEVITVVDMAEYGLPQRRRRMLAGRFPLDLLERYRVSAPVRTLGNVVSALNDDPVTDPVYGFTLDATLLTQNERESPLDDEETRMNSEAKQFHPFYNRRSFPDPFDRPSRTVTATCTRVSRESIVIRDRRGRREVRRLSLRERASLQGFPITFQFFGSTYATNLKLVGNAVPPLLTYFIGHAFRGTKPQRLRPPENIRRARRLPKETPPPFGLTSNTPRYSAARRFRAVIPNLRFHSGWRFELANRFSGDTVGWAVAFYYGASKSIQSVALDEELMQRLSSHAGFKASLPILHGMPQRFGPLLNGASPGSLQDVWSRRASGVHPYDIVDELGVASLDLVAAISEVRSVEVTSFVLRELRGDPNIELHPAHDVVVHGPNKAFANAPAIFAGFILGAWFNTESRLSSESRREVAV